MVKNLIALALAGTVSSTAMAANVSVSTIPFQVLPLHALAVVDFDAGLPGNFTNTLTGNSQLFTGSNGSIGAAPMDDATQYMVVSSGSYSLLGATGYNDMSFYWGSIDGGNRVDLLDAAGNSFYTIFGNSPLLTWSADGNWWGDWSNRTIQFKSDQKIYGAKFSYDGVAFELDNVAFGAVPEPTSWAMMVAGFGLLGATMRRRKTNVAFA
jgi:hypothetical protein